MKDHDFKFPRQDSLDEQMFDLMKLAVAEGMYDAHDWLRRAYLKEV